jgi:ATP-dependent exoDNAse (exonuclease V) beta subunit
MTRTVAGGVRTTSGDPRDDAHASDRVRGLVVHRLLERRGFEPWSTQAERSRAVLGVLRREELSEIDDLTAFVESVAETYQQVCERGDVRAIYAQGECFHEVPFSLHEDEVVVRGTIDCLVRVDEQRLVVLEFKTGRPRPEHETQIALYCLAVRRLFPSCLVEPKLVYSSVQERK